MNLEGKIAIITGAGLERGFGRATALELAKMGANVVISDLCQDDEKFPELKIGSWEGLNKLADEIRALGRESLKQLKQM